MAIFEPPSFKELARVHRGWCNYCQGEWQICRDAPRGGCSLRDCEVEIENAGGNELVADLHAAGTIARAIGNAAPQAGKTRTAPTIAEEHPEKPAVAAPEEFTFAASYKNGYETAIETAAQLVADQSSYWHSSLKTAFQRLAHKIRALKDAPRPHNQRAENAAPRAPTEHQRADATAVQASDDVLRADSAIAQPAVAAFSLPALDYEAIWQRAKEKAKHTMDLRYPPEERDGREREEHSLAVKFYAEMTKP